jgi:hypothetical protein
MTRRLKDNNFIDKMSCELKKFAKNTYFTYPRTSMRELSYLGYSDLRTVWKYTL